MKTGKNNIDELFRSGLSEFTAQPSKSLWRRLSWQMLWKEAAHFNFNNVPASWTTVPAAAIIIATVALFYFNSPSETEKNYPSDQILPTTRQNDANKPPADLYKVETGITHDGLTDKNSTVDHQSLPPLPGRTEKQDAQLSKSAVKPQPGATGIDAITGAETQAQTTIIEGKPDLEVTHPGIQNQKEVAAAIPRVDPVVPVTIPMINNEAAAKEHNEDDFGLNSTILPEKTSVESRIFGIVQLGRIGIKDLEPVTMAERNAMDFNTYKYFTGKTNNETALKQKDAVALKHSTGKPISLSSTNHSLTYLFRGQYKPPKREFQTLVIKNQRRKTSHLTLALYATPEITEYARMTSSSHEKSLATGLAVGYNTPTYIIQGGIEFSYIYDLGDYMVNMETYDSIGFYQHVNGFTIDPENPGNLIYDIQEVGVWDSVSHQSHQQTKNNYTYLQLPIMFGYKAMEHGNFSAYIKAGPNFSILLNKNEPGLEFYQPGATINTIDNYTLPRLTTSIQLLVSLGLQFQVSEKLGIMLEPVYRYYLGTVYEMNSNNEKLTNPYGIGLRTGVFYTF
ncbi:MAG: outer membrane beta-barrel protein [Bacteroidales bacterium]|nr:outer membrane beta-barrel protein [Bacteroidales bacterium]